MKETEKIKEFCNEQAVKHKASLKTCKSRDKPYHAAFRQAYLSVIDFIEKEIRG